MGVNVGNLGQRNVIFQLLVDFRATGGDRRSFKGSNESQDLKVLDDLLFRDTLYTLPPITQ